jgi:hypothetical protein
MPSDDKGEEESRPGSQNFPRVLGVETITKPDECLSVIRNGRGITVVREGNILRVVLKMSG